MTRFYFSLGMDPCDAGWSANGGNCYKIFDDWRTWYNSKVACRQLGGDLASMTSSAEQSFVAGKVHTIRIARLYNILQ